MQKRNNIFINVIKENYTFLLLLIFLTVVISIQGCYSYTGTGGTPAPNCCKIKNPALVTQACVYGDLDTSECAAIALQSGSSYELVPQDACADYYGNPDCGTDEFINKIGCYLDDGSGVNRFYPQYNYPDPDNPQPASSFCGYGSNSLYKCDGGQAVLQQDCAPNYCVSGACTATCTPQYCVSGQIITNCNTPCSCFVSVASFFFEEPSASTTVTDSSGNVIGTKYGGVTQVAGKIGNALNFDGVNDYVGVNFMQVKQNITVLLWAKSNTAVWNNAGWIASARGNNGFLVTPLFGQKNVGGYIMNSLSQSNWIGSYVPDDITQWHQYGIRYNYQTKEASLIFDGQIVVSKIIDISRTTGTITVNFGRDTGTVVYGNGAIDEVEIYNIPLSEQEILARYQSSSHLCA